MEITLLTYEDLVWPLGTQEMHPTYKVGCGHYKRDYKIDPYPCYSHEVERVKEHTSKCEEVFPLHGARTAFYLLSHEGIDRVNGTTYEDTLYRQRTEEVKCGCGCGAKVDVCPLATWVVLAGKRIPPLPSMTRYLVSHEYGHMVWNHILHNVLKVNTGCGSFMYEKYMKLRGVTDYTTTYSGGKWHKNPGEIVANDFRVIFTGYEREFWPHEVPYPEATPIVDWWMEMKDKSEALKNQ